MKTASFLSPVTRHLSRFPSDDELGDGLQLHVGSALVDRADLGVAPELLDGVVLDEAVAAVEFNRTRGDSFRDARRVELRHRGLLDEGESGVLHARGVVDQKARGLDVGRHLRELELDGLELVDRAPELRALRRVRERVFERAARESDHLRADADAPLVQSLDGDFISAAYFAEHVLLRHAAGIEDYLRGRGGADAELVLLLADREALKLFLDDEGRDASVARLRVRVGEDDEDTGLVAVRYPELLSVQLVVVAAVYGARRHREGVGAGACFRQGVSADGVRGEARKVLPFLLGVAPAYDGVIDESVLHIHQHADRRVDAREFLDADDCGEEGSARAAVLFRRLDAHQSEVEELLDEFGRHLRVLVHLLDAWAYLALGELAHRGAEHLLVLGVGGQRAGGHSFGCCFTHGLSLAGMKVDLITA